MLILSLYALACFFLWQAATTHKCPCCEKRNVTVNFSNPKPISDASKILGSVTAFLLTEMEAGHLYQENLHCNNCRHVFIGYRLK